MVCAQPIAVFALLFSGIPPGVTGDLAKAQGKWLGSVVVFGSNTHQERWEFQFTGHRILVLVTAENGRTEKTLYRVTVNEKTKPRSFEVSMDGQNGVFGRGVYRMTKDRIEAAMTFAGNPAPGDLKKGKDRMYFVIERESAVRRRLEKLFD